MKKTNDLSPEFVRDLTHGVGRVIIAFAMLEHAFGFTLVKILKLTRLQERSLIFPMSISNKVSLLRTLYKEYGKRNKETHRWFKYLMRDIEHAASRRNELAHSFYGVQKGKFDLLTFSESARLSGQPVSWTPLHLNRLADRIGLLQETMLHVPRTFPKNLKPPKLRPASEPSLFAKEQATGKEQAKA